jgi:hypothetical protein
MSSVTDVTTAPTLSGVAPQSGDPYQVRHCRVRTLADRLLELGLLRLDLEHGQVAFRAAPG